MIPAILAVAVGSAVAGRVAMAYKSKVQEERLDDLLEEAFPNEWPETDDDESLGSIGDDEDPIQVYASSAGIRTLSGLDLARAFKAKKSGRDTINVIEVPRYRDLGNVLKLLLARREISQSALARLSKVDRTLLNSYISGKRLPSRKTMTKLAHALDVDEDRMNELRKMIANDYTVKAIASVDPAELQELRDSPGIESGMAILDWLEGKDLQLQPVSQREDSEPDPGHAESSENRPPTNADIEAVAAKLEKLQSEFVETKAELERLRRKQ